MKIVYAAEKTSIADVLEEHLHMRVDPDEIDVSENPGETGSFYIGWHRQRFLLSPAGRVTTAWSLED